MRICMPTETNKGKQAGVYGHFGSAPYFTIYDTEKDSVDVIDNGNLHHTHGSCHPMGALSSKDVDVVLCGGMGARAVQKLNEAGIKVYRGMAGTVEEMINNFKQSKLEEITIDNACSQHSCH